MTIDSVGYGKVGEGSVTDKEDALRAQRLSAPPVVTSGCEVTVTSAVNRTVQIATGVLQGHGIRDTVSEVETLTLDTQASGTRWDAIVAHRNWQATPIGETTAEFVKGATTSATAIVPTLDGTPGTVADHLLALIPVTSSGAGNPIPMSLFTGGAPGYWPRTDGSQIPNLGLYYGQTCFQYQPAGIQNKLWLRRGTDANPILDDMFDPAWQKVDTVSSVSAAFTGQEFRLRVVGGHLEIAGELERTSGNFAMGGGNDGDYDIADVPTAMQPTQTRFVGVTWNAANVQVRFDKPSGRIKARVFSASSNRAFLDGIRFPLN